MIIRAFAIYDLKSGAYALPFFMHHVGEAVRACIDVARDPNTTINRHPADFALHEVGTFDTETGWFQPVQPISHGAVVSFLPEQRPMPLFEHEGIERAMTPKTNGSGPYTPVVEGL